MFHKLFENPEFWSRSSAKVSETISSCSNICVGKYRYSDIFVGLMLSSICIEKSHIASFISHICVSLFFLTKSECKWISCSIPWVIQRQYPWFWSQYTKDAICLVQRPTGTECSVSGGLSRLPRRAAWGAEPWTDHQTGIYRDLSIIKDNYLLGFEACIVYFVVSTGNIMSLEV